VILAVHLGADAGIGELTEAHFAAGLEQVSRGPTVAAHSQLQHLGEWGLGWPRR